METSTKVAIAAISALVVFAAYKAIQKNSKTYIADLKRAVEKDNKETPATDESSDFRGARTARTGSGVRPRGYALPYPVPVPYYYHEDQLCSYIDRTGRTLTMSCNAMGRYLDLQNK